MKRKIALLLAMMMALGILAGCTGGGEEGDITLKWYSRMNKEADVTEVFKLASDMTKEKIGAALDIIALEDYGTKMPAIIASGEDYDIVYTSSVTVPVRQNVIDGNLLELDELLPKYAPQLWEEVGEDVWNGVRINGKIYSVPNQQIFGRATGFMIPTQNFEALGIDPNTKFEKLADYEEYFKLIKEKTGSYGYLERTWGGDGLNREGFEAVLGSNLPGAIRYKEENPVVVNQYESQEFIDYIKLRRRWVEEGLTAPMDLVGTDPNKYKVPEGEVMPWLFYVATDKPGAVEEHELANGYGVTVTTKVEPLLSSYSLQATMAAVNSDTRYPEKSVEFLNFLNTDAEFYNLLVYGIEGKNYTKLDDKYIERSEEHPYTQSNWAIGNTFNGYLLKGQPENLHEATKEINRTALRSPILGFSADQEPIKLEVANCQAVLGEYLDVLDQGIVDVESTYAAFIEKLKTAGSDKIIEVLNEQLEAWRASK